MEGKSATSQPTAQSSGGRWGNENHPGHPRVRAYRRAQYAAARRSKRLQSEPSQLQRRLVEHSGDPLASRSTCVHQVLAELHAGDQKLTGETE
jgi:hypothetical protein